MIRNHLFFLVYFDQIMTPILIHRKTIQIINLLIHKQVNHMCTHCVNQEVQVIFSLALTNRILKQDSFLM